MYPLLLCSIASLAIFLERLWALRRSRVVPRDFLIEAEENVRQRRIVETVTLCKKNDSSVARIMLAALRNFGRSREVIKEVVEEIGRFEAIKLGQYLEALSTIASISTLLGLLGTISGMVKVFHVVSVGGLGNASLLSSGISEALYTTVTGLTIAIPTVVAYKYCLGRANRFITEMEHISLLMLEHLKKEDIS